jgi:hypothetical protein
MLNYLNRTKIVIPALLSLLVLFSVLLYRNYTKKIQASDNPTIGVLTFKTKTIQRKYDGEVVWESIPTETQIKNKDTIRTDKLSEAVLTLEDGTKIQIGENSMILVDFSDKKWNLNFAYGTLSAVKSESGESALSIQSGNNKIEVGSGELSINRVGEDLEVNLSSGAAKIKTGDKESDIGTDQKARVTSGGIEVLKQGVRGILPADRSFRLVDTSKSTIRFEWEKAQEISPRVRFEISKDLGFRKIYRSKELTATVHSEILEPAVYYWRLGYKTGEGKSEFSPVYRFSLLQRESVSLYTPNPSQAFRTLPSVSLPPVLFSWSKSDLFSSYALEIAKDPQFSSLLITKETRSSSIGIPDMSPGSYYWRVRARSAVPNESDLVSETRNFLIETRTELEKIKTVYPARNEILARDRIEKSGIVLSWKGSTDYFGYEVILAKDQDFKNILQKETQSNNFMKIATDLDPGTYFWKVTGDGKDGTKLDSDIASFQIKEGMELKLLNPPNGSRQELTEKGAIRFAWTALPNGKSAILEISRDSEFKKILVEKDVTGSSESIPFDLDGKIYWRLRQSKTTQESSDVFQLILVNRIPAPKIGFPGKNTTVDMTVRSSLNFQWTGVPEADQYNLVLFDVTGIREREILNIKTGATNYNLSDLTKLNQGKFRWEVKSLKKNSDGGFSESQPDRGEFFITLTMGITTKILTPEKIYVE